MYVESARQSAGHRDELLPQGSENDSDLGFPLGSDEEFYFFFTASLHRGQTVGKVQSCC